MKECCVAYLSEQFGNDAELGKEIYGEYVSSMRVKGTEAELIGLIRPDELKAMGREKNL